MNLLTRRSVPLALLLLAPALSMAWPAIAASAAAATCTPGDSYTVGTPSQTPKITHEHIYTSDRDTRQRATVTMARKLVLRTALTGSPASRDDLVSAVDAKVVSRYGKHVSTLPSHTSTTRVTITRNVDIAGRYVFYEGSSVYRVGWAQTTCAADGSASTTARGTVTTFSRRAEGGFVRCPARGFDHDDYHYAARVYC